MTRDEFLLDNGAVPAGVIRQTLSVSAVRASSIATNGSPAVRVALDENQSMPPARSDIVGNTDDARGNQTATERKRDGRSMNLHSLTRNSTSTHERHRHGYGSHEPPH